MKEEEEEMRRESVSAQLRLRASGSAQATHRVGVRALVLAVEKLVRVLLALLVRLGRVLRRLVALAEVARAGVGLSLGNGRHGVVTGCGWVWKRRLELQVVCTRASQRERERSARGRASEPRRTSKAEL